MNEKWNVRSFLVALATWVLGLASLIVLFVVGDGGLTLWRNLQTLFGGATPLLTAIVLVLNIALSVYLWVRAFRGKKVGLGLWCCLIVSALGLFLLLLSFLFDELGQMWIYWLVASLIVAAALILGVIFILPRVFAKGRIALRIVSCVVLACLGVCGILRIQINAIWFDPAVYAVEDEYQIVWYTSANSTGWVEIGGQRYYDAQSGNIRSGEKVHKVTVPMTVLDEAKAYSIHSQGVLIHHGYFSVKGRELSESYTFRPLDASDGIQIQNVSDTHNSPAGAAASAAYWGDRLDLLILNGDIANGGETERDVLEILDAASRMAGGEIPVIYARGNHETRGAAAASAYKYIGCSAEGNAYFEVRLGPVWILVLDAAEDKEDSHREYSGMADYSAYRVQEGEWLREVLANPAESYQAPGVEYRMLVSHIPFNAVTNPEPELYAQWVEMMNGVDLDVALAGHTHQCAFLEPNGTYREQQLASNYWTVIGSAQKDIATDESDAKHRSFTTTAVELQPDVVTARFVNQSLEVCDEIVIPR